MVGDTVGIGFGRPEGSYVGTYEGHVCHHYRRLVELGDQQNTGREDLQYRILLGRYTNINTNTLTRRTKKE